MITDEMLEFIRAQRGTGLSDAELSQMLLTEGGWDKSDVDEAYRTLDALSVAPTSESQSYPPVPAPAAPPPTVSLPPPPTFSAQSAVYAPSSAASDIFAQGGGRVVNVTIPPPLMPPVPPPLSPRVEERTAPVVSPMGSVLSGASSDRPLSQTKMAHDDFTKLFSGSKKEETTATPPVRVLPVTPPPAPPPRTVAPVPAPVAQPQNVSRAPSSPSPAASSNIKFDLSSAFRANTQRATPPPAGVSLESHVAEFGKGSASSSPAAPVEVVRQKISGKRTMSGDLMRGAGLPPLSADPETPGGQFASVGESETRIELPLSSANTEVFPDNVARRKKMKRVLFIVIGIVFLAALIGGGIFAFLRFRGSDSAADLGAAFGQFFESTAFAYNGMTNVDLTLSGVTPGSGTDGKIKFILGYNGTLANSKEGFSDGTHRVTFDGGWQSGTSTFGTNIESDVIVLGNNFHFNVLSIPKESELDQELLRSNWVRVNFTEIAREFHLSGTAQGEEEYGSFGGTTGDTSLRAVLARSLIFVASGDPEQEDVKGVMQNRIPVRLDTGRSAELLRSLYRKYFNRSFTLSEEEELRFKGALEKCTGNVWTDIKTGALVKTALTCDLDDAIGGTNVKGPVTLEFSFADFNKPPLFGTPAPVLSLQELRIQMEESGKFKGAREQDALRVRHMTTIAEALEFYRKEKGRYPKELTELYAAKKLTVSSIDLTVLKDYLYRSYQNGSNVAKSGGCLTTGKVCAFYHLGTNLLDLRSSILLTDADRTTAILGADKAGCSGEANVSCYDIESPPESQTSSGTTSGATASTAKTSPVPSTTTVKPATTVTAPASTPTAPSAPAAPSSSSGGSSLPAFEL